MTYDLNMIQGLVPAGMTQVTLGLGTGQAVTGVQKLVQQVWLLLLTEQGSVFADPAAGTEFFTLARTGRLATDADVTLNFRLAADTILTYLTTNTPAAAPLDEQLTSLTLVSFALLPGQLSLTVLVTAASGNARQVVLPVNVVGG
jgi:hypothetical protein